MCLTRRILVAGNEQLGVNVSVGSLDLAALLSSDDREVQRRGLGTLFDAEFSSVYAFVFARSGSATTADDVASETFADAARAVHNGQGHELSRSWLFMVARRRLIDHWRADERQRRRIGRLRLARDTFDVSGETMHDEQVLDALASLPTRQRAALTLRYLDEYSVVEVAETLNVSYRAAESLLSRARSGFAQAFGASR